MSTEESTGMQVLKVSLLSLQVCVPKNSKKVDIEAFANQHSPTGIASNWQLDPVISAIECAQDPERIHLLLVC